jgi:predicted nucleic acid-binding protein
MTAELIIDCSVAMTWLFTDEATHETGELLNRLRNETSLVPGWWYLEVINVLSIAERKRRITLTQASDFLSQISKLDIEIDGEAPARAFDEILPLCRAHHLTSYDAMYLELAIRRGLPLATLDGPLRKAARKLGVKVLGR